MYYHIVKKEGLKYKDLDIKEVDKIIKIVSELEKRSSKGDEKAKEELDKWDKMLKEMKL